jgi:hypothetical protein
MDQPLTHFLLIASYRLDLCKVLVEPKQIECQIKVSVRSRVSQDILR